MSRRRTVLHLIDTGGPGGAETIFHSLVTGLDASMWKSVPVVPVVDWLHDALTGAGVEPLLLNPRGTGNVRYLSALHSMIRDHHVDLIHSHLLGSAVYGTLAAIPAAIPCICTFHGIPDIPQRGRFLSIKLRIIQRERNRLVFVSESLQDQMIRRHGLSEAHSRVVHNGVALRMPALTGCERTELGAGPGDFLVVAVGNLRPAKDYGTLLRAADILRREGVPLRLVILGEGKGPLLQDLERERKALELTSTVSFGGFRSDASRLLASADAFVSSSTTEGFSLATVEALWLRRPVVVTRSGGPESIVEDGRTGRLVPVSNPVALARALMEVHRSPDRAKRWGEAGCQDVQRRFSRDAMLRGYETLYTEMLSMASASSDPVGSRLGHE